MFHLPLGIPTGLQGIRVRKEAKNIGQSEISFSFPFSLSPAQTRLPALSQGAAFPTTARTGLVPQLVPRVCSPTTVDFHRVSKGFKGSGRKYAVPLPVARASRPWETRI